MWKHSSHQCKILPCFQSHTSGMLARFWAREGAFPATKKYFVKTDSQSPRKPKRKVLKAGGSSSNLAGVRPALGYGNLSAGSAKLLTGPANVSAGYGNLSKGFVNLPISSLNCAQSCSLAFNCIVCLLPVPSSPNPALRCCPRNRIGYCL